MDVRFINPFIRSCHQLFDRHLGMNLTVDKPFVKGTHALDNHDRAISIAVDLSGAVEGRVKVHFAEAVAIALAESFSGTTSGHIDEATKDALRELANILVGSAKREFPGTLTRISLPQVVSSPHDEWRKEHGVLVIPMHSAAGRMYFEVKIHSVDESVRSAHAIPPGPLFLEPAVDEVQVQAMVERLLNAANA